MLDPGSRLGFFEIAGQLGAGGMGEVYRARDTILRREVAIKLLPAKFAVDAVRLARFKREAMLTAGLNHPNIAGLYDFQNRDGHCYLVLELVEGDTLSERLNAGPLPVMHALRIFAQIARGVGAANERGIVHRDLKPSNIKITAEDEVKILDFGIAKCVDDGLPAEDVSASNDHRPAAPHTPPGLTNVGIVIGTPSYMSPEQARGRPVDRRTDVWAFGCCFYEALTGVRPFHGETAAEIIAGILETEPDWALLPAEMPGELRTLLARCLEKDPGRRLRDANDIAVAIEEALKSSKTLHHDRHASRHDTRAVVRTGGAPNTSLPKKGRGLAIRLSVSISALLIFSGAAVWYSATSATPSGGPSIIQPPVDPPPSELPVDGGERLYVQTAAGLFLIDTGTEITNLVPWAGAGSSVGLAEEGFFLSDSSRGGDILVFSHDGKVQPQKTTPIPAEAGEYSGFILLPGARFALLDGLNDAIYFVDRSDGPVTRREVPLGPASRDPSGVVVEEALYVSENGYKGIWKIDLVTYVVSDFRNLSGIPYVNLGPIAFADGEFYVATDNDLYRFTETEGPEWVVTLPSRNISGLTISDRRAWVTDDKMGTVYEVNLDSGRSELIASDLDGPKGIAGRLPNARGDEPPPPPIPPPKTQFWHFNETTQHWYTVTEPGKWSDACRSANRSLGYLVSIADEAENAWVVRTFGDSADESALWIGLGDVNEEAYFVWDSGEPLLYHNWANGDPRGSTTTIDQDVVSVRVRQEESAGGVGTWELKETSVSQIRGIVERDTNPQSSGRGETPDSTSI